MMEKIIRKGEYEWELPIGTVPDMRVPGRFYLSQQLMGTLEEGAVTQLANIATLPGICKHSLAMPDIHWGGYGFPIGGVWEPSPWTKGSSPPPEGLDLISTAACALWQPPRCIAVT